MMRTKQRCVECGRVFDLTNSDEAEEWYYGHDCEDKFRTRWNGYVAKLERQQFENGEKR